MTEAPSSIPLEIQESAKRMLEKHRATVLKRNYNKAKWQRDLEDVDRRMEDVRAKAKELRQEYMMDPHLREIQSKLMRKLDIVKGDKGLVCPACGEDDKNNRMNGQPWCFKCNSPLVSKDKIKMWKKLPTVKVAPKDLREELKKLNRGLYPKEES